MFKKFLMKKALQSQMSQVPQEHREKVEKMLEKDPDLLMQIAQEVQAEMKSGKDQMAAFTHVAEKHKDKLKELLS